MASEGRMAVEQSLIAAALQGPEYVDRIAAQVSDKDFTHAGYSAVWSVLRRMAESDQAFDPALVFDELTRVKRIPADVTMTMLVSLAAASYEISHIDHYCRRLNQHATAEAAQKIGEQLSVETEANQEVIDEYISKLDSIRRDRHDEVATINDALEGLKQNAANPRKVYQTGFPQIDMILKGGIRDGQIVVIGGRPGSGKSVLLTQIAAASAERGIGALIVSLEMLKEEVVGRLCRHYQEDRLRVMPLFFLDTTSDMNTIAALVKVAVRRWPIGLVAVDYLQLAEVQGNRNDNRERQIATVSRRLKRLAMDLQKPILVGSQLNRESTKRSRPTLADLRESGAIEQDADIVMLLHRDDEGDDTNVEIAKHRGGATGSVSLRLNGPSFRFEDNISWAERI